jgi:hypothetical protein
MCCCERADCILWQNNSCQPKYWTLVVLRRGARHEWAEVAKFIEVYEVHAHSVHCTPKCTEARIYKDTGPGMSAAVSLRTSRISDRKVRS